MAIDGIKNSVMGQMTRVEPAAPAENIEVSTAVSVQNFSPVMGLHREVVTRVPDKRSRNDRENRKIQEIFKRFPQKKSKVQ